MSVKITLTNVGSNISPTLDIYSNATGTWVFFKNVSVTDLLGGYVFTPPLNATGYQVRDTGACGTILELYCEYITTTTTYNPSYTTTTTTTAAPVYWYILSKCIPNGTDYYAGPFYTNMYSMGDRVEGATSTYYVVIGSYTTEPVNREKLSGITGTGYRGCP